MIDHDAARELAATQLDFDLSSTDQDRLLAHLVDCAECRAFVEGLEADHRAITGLASQDAPADLRDRILASVDAPAAPDAPGAEYEPEPSYAEPQRPTPIRSIVPKRYRWPLVTAAAAVIIVALVAGGLVWRPSDGPNVAHASPTAPTGSGAAPAGSGAVPPSAEPAPSIEPGSKLAASPWNEVADLTADDAPGGVVDLASGFRLTSLDGTPAAELAKRLTVEPEIAFSAAAGSDPKTVEITPTEALKPGAVYRFSLTAADGQEVGTWAFQAHQPLRIVGALPNDTETDVPLNTGIEITFDQDGVVDAESHVTISPNVAGRFEQHGRVLAFVPDKPLDAATIYTVTVSPGIEVGGTGEQLEQEFKFQFETAAVGTIPVETTFQFSSDLFETATKDRPIIALWAFQDNGEDDPAPPPPTSAPLEIYRIDGLDAAMTAYRQLRTAPRWSRQNVVGLIPTTGLSQVLKIDASLAESEGVLWTELPEPLPAGWYLVQLASPTRPIQAMLQVTDIASYLVVSDTKTLLWTNDLATGGALSGAVASTAEGNVGTTGADGTLLATTPPSVMPVPSGTCKQPCISLIAVHAGDRSSFVPASEPSDPQGKGGGGYSDQVDESVGFWHAFDTDRSMFRRTDTVNTWGVVRDRDSGVVPAVVTISLSALDSDTGDAGPAIVAHEVHPNKLGAFSDSIKFEDLPQGQYELDLHVGSKLVASTGIGVDRILKPAYGLEVTTGRRVYVAGDTIRITANANFYEGSPVPGIRLRLDGIVSGGLTTDEAGVATRRTVARVGRNDDEDESDGSAEVQSVDLSAASAEEGAITGSSREIVVFPSNWVISGTATVRNGRVRATGHLNELDRDRVEREVNGGEDPWSLDPAGKALAGRTVTLTFFDSETTRRESGTRYDFIEKKVVPTYESGTTERVARTVRVTTDSKGRFSASIPAAGNAHSYRVRATATDPDRLVARWVQWAGESEGFVDQVSTSLTLTADGTTTNTSFGVGDTIDLTMTDPTATGEGAQDRYLFYSAQRGLRDVTVQDSARYQTTFGRSAVPTLQIDSVRFNGSRYSETTTFGATFAAAERSITVGISADRSRYVPGDDVQLQVTTRDPSGDPVAATVILRAVDEKLFTLGGATAADPLNEIYTDVESGIRVTYRSHRSPRAQSEFGGGDTTGGGGDDRIDFRDQILFRSVDTGSDGKASVTMHLSDDLTSWHVGASAIGSGLTAGEGTLLVPVGLPFFAEATIAPEYLVSDRPEIGLRAFGTALTATSPVTFAVDSDILGLHVHGLDAHAFETITVALPKLTLGRHAVTITAQTGSGSSARKDRLTRTFVVIGSRLERARTGYKEITGITHVEGGDGLTEVTISDIGVGRYAPLILDLTDVDSVRLERVLAAAEAATLAKEQLHIDDATGSADFDGARYQTADGGLALVPYGGSDLEASALAALIAPDRFDVGGLRTYLAARASDDKETRERRNFALAGLAGLGASVLPEIRAAAADPNLTVRERLMLGIGAASLGDGALAHKIAASLVETYGETAAGDQARLRVGSDAGDVTQATALMAILAAANGDPLGPRFWAYVGANPDEDATYALHAVGFVDRILEHAAPTTAKFTYTSGGDRKVVKLEPGEAFHVTLLASQLASFTVEPESGSVAVTTAWREPVDPDAFKKDRDIKISRKVTPAGAAKSSDLVKVALVVEFGPLQPTGCVMVTDYVPSGLVPVGNLRGWVDEEEESDPQQSTETRPFAQTGQRVYFCAEPTPDHRKVTLRYVARVISPGRYTWETAIAQSPFRPDSAALTGATVIRID